MGWVSLLLRAVLVVLLWLPLQGVRLLRWLQLRSEQVVIRLDLSADAAPARSAGRARQLELLDLIAADTRIAALYIRLEATPAGWAELQSLRAALQRVRDSGKQIIVYTEQVSNAGLYLASVAHHLWMPPVGDVFLSGLGGRLNFFGNILARFGVRVDFEAAGTFKSFGEPFSRGYASPANREQLEALYGNLQDQLLDGLSQGRGLAPDAARALLAASPMSAEAALGHKLIDDVLYRDQIKAKLEAVLGDSIKLVSFRGFSRLARLEQWMVRAGSSRQSIVVVHLEGSIVMGGDGGRGQRIEARQVVPALHALAEDDSVRAVVLQVDSGGGSALASDLIARAVRKLGEKKPVIASFGNVVASGGYYLSAPAREIVAWPGTITGSIGVIGGKVVVGDALARQRLTGDVIAVGPDVGLMEPWAPFTADQRRRFRAYLEETYTRFLQIVAGGRRCPVDAIEPHAGGRVWTGIQGQERNLIDRFGGLPVALQRARLLTDLEPGTGRVLHLEFAPSRFRTVASLLSGQVRADPVALALALGGPHTALVRMLRDQPGQALALCPLLLEEEGA